MNKALLAIVVIQAVLVGALVFRFGALQAQSDRMEQAMALYMSAQNGARPIEVAPAPHGGMSAPTPEYYDALRTIVREEVNRLADEIELAQSVEPAAASSPRPQAQQPALPPAQTAQLYKDFQNELISLRSKGPLAPGDMAQLEQTIARMPADMRTRALSELSREMSRGSIDAKL